MARDKNSAFRPFSSTICLLLSTNFTHLNHAWVKLKDYKQAEDISNNIHLSFHIALKTKCSKLLTLCLQFPKCTSLLLSAI